MSLSKTPSKLKGPRPWVGSSSSLHATAVPKTDSPRDYYLSRPHLVFGPILSCSDFLPRALIPHLMRSKKDSALAVKYSPGDAITNMEGALHTFLTPVLLALMFGDYVFRTQHGVQGFHHGIEGFPHEIAKGMRVAREVILSAALQMDFEERSVMLAVCSLGDEEVVGRDLGAGFEVLTTRQKRDRDQRLAYEDALKRHMIAHLLQEGRLPALSKVDGCVFERVQTLLFLEQFVVNPEWSASVMVGKFIGLEKGGDVLSLELLFNTAVHQLRNELSALETVATQGYIYTYDPASIFAGAIGAALLNRIMLAAIRQLSSENHFLNMRAYAFNDYADTGAMRLVRAALAKQKHVKVLSKSKLFQGPHDTYDPSRVQGGKEAWLVIHNNSDAFGQNIETEGEHGSMDGAVGANSSAAASLERGRADLLKYII